MLNNNEPNSYFYFSLCLSKIEINNMGVWALTAANCGPAVLKYPLKYLLLPEVHFLLALDFRWGAQTYWRCWEWWRWSSVSRRVSQLMWLVHLVRMHSGCLPRGHFQPSRRLQGRPSTYRRDYIPHICQDYTLCPRGGAGLGTRSVK